MAAILLLVAISAPLLLVFGPGHKTIELMISIPLYYFSLIHGAIWHSKNVRRFGKHMTIEQIFLDKEPKRVAQLLFYHHQWPNAKIANVLNERKIDYGKRWTESMVASCTNGIAKVW